MGAIPLQEYVIKLGVQADWTNINKVLGALKSTKLQTVGVMAAIVSAGTAIYKFVKTQTLYEQSLVSIARKQKKSVEDVRASENALKAMGKTIKEVAKDPALKKMYDDLVKVNKTMALPNMKGALSNVANLQGAFTGLKSTISYALQWINARILANLQEPIRQMTETFKKISEWIRRKIGEISGKIGRFVSSFAAGLLGVVKIGAKVLEFFEQLPASAKTAIAAVSMLLLALKSGPLGWIMMAITAIGGLFQDYNNYKWNKAHPDEIPVDIAFPGIWEILDDETMNGGEKFIEIGKKVGMGLLEGLKSLTVTIVEWLVEVAAAALEGIGDVIVSNLPDPVKKLLGIDDKKKSPVSGEIKGVSEKGVIIAGLPEPTRPKEKPFVDAYEDILAASGAETHMAGGVPYLKPPKMTGQYSEWIDFEDSWNSAKLDQNTAKLKDLASIAAQFQQDFGAAPNGAFFFPSKEEKEVLAFFQAQLDEINAKDYSVKIEPELDASKIPAELNTLQGYINGSPLKIPVTLGTPGGTKKNALGGRYGSRIVTEVAEDGDPEYIIPIKKEGRAIPLIMSMLKEMGSSAVNKVAEGLGIGGGSLGGLAGVMGTMQGGGLTINNYNTVNASNTINIQATGADGKEIGQTAYDATERYLVRTLRGVLEQ